MKKILKIAQFIHDWDHTSEPTNLDIWIERQNNCESTSYKIFEEQMLPDPEDLDMIVLHGGMQHLWNKRNDPWLYIEIEYIRKALEKKTPVIGFCLGSQIIAEALGVKVFKADITEIGLYSIKTVKDQAEQDILYGLKDEFITYEWHTDHYNLPENCKTLAYTEDIENQIFISDNFPAVGFQFHPEYTKSIIAEYIKTFPDMEWKINMEVKKCNEFLNYLDSIPDTYYLFEKLMENSITLFQKKFGRLESI